MNKKDNENIGVGTIILYVVTTALVSSSVTYGVMADKDILGFVGSIVGIVGAYLILKEQLFQENKKAEIEANEKENLELELLSLLLESTVRDTDKVVCEMAEVYVNFFKNDISRNFKGNQVFKLKLEDIRDCKHNKIFSDLILRVAEEGVLADKEYFKKVLSNNEFETLEISLRDNYKELYEKLYYEFNKINDYKALVYDKNWSKYVINIKGKVNENEVNYTEKSVMIYINKWLSLLESNSIENNLNKLNNIDINIDNDVITGKKIDIKKIQIKKELANHIKELIHLRDIIIEILPNVFNIDLEDIRSSYNYLEECFLTENE